MKPRTAEEADVAASEARTLGAELVAEGYAALARGRSLERYAKRLRNGGAPIETAAADFRRHLRAALDGAQGAKGTGT
jgi:hypothetical protein